MEGPREGGSERGREREWQGGREARQGGGGGGTGDTERAMSHASMLKCPGLRLKVCRKIFMFYGVLCAFDGCNDVTSYKLQVRAGALTWAHILSRALMDPKERIVLVFQNVMTLFID